MSGDNLAVITTHITPAVGYGGPAVSVAVLIREWAREGRSILLCSSDASTDGTLEQGDIQLGDSVSTTLYHSYWFKRWAFGLGAIPAIYRTCRNANVVYVNGNATWPMTLAPIVCFFLRRPYIVALRGGLMPEHVATMRKKKYYKWIYYKLLSFPFLRRASVIHCTAKMEAESARRLLGADVNTVVIPNGIELRTIKRKPLSQKDPMVICYVGRISEEKGINFFIESWLKCKEHHDRLVVAGSGLGAYFRRFMRLVDLADGSICYEGYLDSDGVSGLIDSCHFLVLPSKPQRENFGNVVAEALARGRPVMVTRGLAWDHVEEERIGFLFDHNAESVCRTIRGARSAVLEQMSDAAFRYAVKNFDVRVLADRLWQAMHDCA